MKKPDIYAYFDFRKYLKDLTIFLKTEKKFNLRNFARQAGIKAPSYLKMVIDGRRNLTGKTVNKFCEALNISDRPKIYFEKLVLYNQTKNPDLKKGYFEDLTALRPRSSHYILKKQHNRYFSQPHYVTIREMVALKDFRENYKWIAKRCLPPISPSEAREAIKTLLELDLIKRDDKGRLVQTEGFIKTEDKNTEIVETYHFHEAMLDKARHALGILKQNERNYYALTLPLTSKMYEEIIDDFYRFRDQIVEKVNSEDENPDEVYQINFQLFPATKKGGETP